MKITSDLVELAAKAARDAHVRICTQSGVVETPTWEQIDEWQRADERAQMHAALETVAKTIGPARRTHIACPYCDTSLDLTEPLRSVPQHRRYFALIRKAYHHWPESHERQFSEIARIGEVQCRKYLQMKAGHRKVVLEFPLIGMRKETAITLVEAAISAMDDYGIPVVDTGKLYLWKPLSIAFDRLSHKEACKLFADVAEVITAETGIDCDTLLKARAA